MTDLLLGYIAVAFTAYAGLECWRANHYRSHTAEYQREATELYEDQVDARLLGLERELLRQRAPLPQEPDYVVARAGRQDHRGDEEHLESELAHDLMVVAASEGIALR